MKLLAIITTICLVILTWVVVARQIDKFQDKCEHLWHEHRIKRAMMREFKKVFGGIPKKTKHGIKVGKMIFKNENDFDRYMMTCIAKAIETDKGEQQ